MFDLDKLFDRLFEYATAPGLDTGDFMIVISGGFRKGDLSRGQEAPAARSLILWQHDRFGELTTEQYFEVDSGKSGARLTRYFDNISEVALLGTQRVRSRRILIIYKPPFGHTVYFIYILR